MKILEGKWNEGDIIREDGDMGKVIIDKNEITFHRKGSDKVFSKDFVTRIDMHNYKVFTYGQDGFYEEGYKYPVSKVYLFKTNSFKKYSNGVNGIVTASFEVPGLAEWLKLNSVGRGYTDNGERYAIEKKVDDILMLDGVKKVSIKYEIKDYFNPENDLVQMSLKKIPRITICYTDGASDNDVIDDIECIMRFMGIIMGKVLYVEDIRIKLADEQNMWMFINKDFSYNYYSDSYYYRHRIDFEKIKNEFPHYFSNWVEFYGNEDYSEIIEIYFQNKGKKKSNLIDRFLVYCKYIEGFDLRTSEDESIAITLGNQIKEKLDKKEVKELFEQIFIDAGSKYKSKSVSKWIATGFLNRVSLVDRIKRVDKEMLSVMKSNSVDLKIDDSDEMFNRIVKTRNYYSHLKMDKNGILDFNQIYRSLQLFEGLVVVTLLNQVGLYREEVIYYMLRDESLWPVFSFLKNEGNT